MKRKKKSLHFAWVLVPSLDSHPRGSGSWRGCWQLQSLKQPVYSRRFVCPAPQRPGGLMWTVAQSHGGGRWHQPQVDWAASHSSAWGCISFGLEIVAPSGGENMLDLPKQEQSLLLIVPFFPPILVFYSWLPHKILVQCSLLPGIFNPLFAASC